jgi:hypothetical protein
MLLLFWLACVNRSHGDHVMGLIMVLFAALNLALVIVVLKHVWPD